MTTKEITLTALLALAVAGNVYFLGADKQTYVAEVVPDPTAKVEVTGTVAEALVAQAQQAGAVGVIECKVGVISNYPDRLYCTDGKTAGWLVDVDKEAELLAAAGREDGSMALEVQDGKLMAGVP